MEDRQTWPASDWDDGVLSPAEIDVPVERAVELIIDGEPLVTLHCTPAHLQELATGFVLDQGIIDSASDIDTCRVNAREGRIEMTLKTRAAVKPAAGRRAIIYSGCGQAAGLAGAAAPGRVPAGTVFPASSLKDALAATLRRGELYRQTRGVHSAALFSRGGRLLVLREDIGRHNALDKALGWAAGRCLEPGRIFVASSGRISSEAVDKLARFGIAMMVSKGMPTSLALKEAERLGIALAGSIGAGRMRIYTHKEKVQT